MNQQVLNPQKRVQSDRLIDGAIMQLVQRQASGQTKGERLPLRQRHLNQQLLRSHIHVRHNDPTIDRAIEREIERAIEQAIKGAAN